MFALCASVKVAKVMVYAVFNALIITGLKMQKFKLLLTAPIASIKCVFTFEAQ